MRKTIIAVGAAALALTAATALAQTQSSGRAARGDADGDGRISRTEFVEARVSRLTAIDANRDGSVSAEERQSGIDTRRNQRASARFEKMDADGNGAISREEFTTAREPRADRGVRGGHRMAGHRVGRRAQGGHAAEARGPMNIAEVQTRTAAQFDRMDADHDGFVTADERRAARQAMRTQWQERRAERTARRAAAQPSPSAPASE